MTAAADLLLAIDQGTSSTRAIAFDRSLRVVATAARSVASHHPRPGWVEQDPLAILDSVVGSVGEVLAAVGGAARIRAAGLANQGESVVAWDASTSEPLSPLVSWQCRRGEVVVERLRAAGLADEVRARSGLPLDPYFSASKAAWLIESVPAVGRAARDGRLRLGTVDAWVTCRLGDRGALTDPSTASRTQLVSLASGRWDEALLGWFGVERHVLPTIVPTAGEAGTLSHQAWGGRVPLLALACDQQAALAGHGGFDAGDAKATFGTGVFVLANGGGRSEPADGLEVSIAWELPGGMRASVIQGGVFAAGALIDWLAAIGVVHAVDDAERMARNASSAGGVAVLPALVGLGSPFYDHAALGVLAGLTTGTTRDDIVRAALDGIAHRTADVVEAVRAATAEPPTTIRVDGGLAVNAYLMERLADLSGVPVEVATAEESTALGIAALAALGCGAVSLDAIKEANPPRRRIEPGGHRSRAAERQAWRDFVLDARVLGSARR